MTEEETCEKINQKITNIENKLQKLFSIVETSDKIIKELIFLNMFSEKAIGTGELEKLVNEYRHKRDL